jgi:hypothetical protein
VGCIDRITTVCLCNGILVTAATAKNLIISAYNNATILDELFKARQTVVSPRITINEEVLV